MKNLIGKVKINKRANKLNLIKKYTVSNVEKIQKQRQKAKPKSKCNGKNEIRHYYKNKNKKQLDNTKYTSLNIVLFLNM